MIRSVCIHSHAWPTAQEMLEWELLSRISAALEIRPCIQPDDVDHTGAYKHLTPFPYSQQTYRFALVELPILCVAKA